MTDVTDILIVGSGIGGATLAAGLADSGAKVTILERGEQLADGPAARDPRAIFVEGRFRPEETWRDARGVPFNPGNYYYVGGNSKLYGAVMLRYRAASWAVSGTQTAVSSPARRSRARLTASRRLVLTRSLGFLGISEGATTMQECPSPVSNRWSPYPVGPLIARTCLGPLDECWAEGEPRDQEVGEGRAGLAAGGG